MKKVFAGLSLAFLAVSSPAQAKWYEASSEHFVIYADDSEKDIRRFAENLERYHSAMTLVTGREVETPSPSNRVVIFVVGDQDDIRELSGGNSSIAGFYIPRAGGSRAFVQNIRNKKGDPSFSTTVLLHEYAHHFLISTSRFAMPRWLGEGAAEFFASTSFESDGSMQVGRPANHRASELAYADEVTVEELLDNELYEKNRGRRYDAFYGMSWALYHYLIFNTERKGQLSAYWREVGLGKSSIEAGREVFGDLDQLNEEILRYIRQRKMFTFSVPPDRISMLPVTLRELPKGEAKMMDLRIISQRGVDREEALELVEKARKIAARYPDDAGVFSALAEAEFDAGNDDAAIAAADRAISLDPARANPYVQKGFALFRKAGDAEDREAAYAEAMKPFSALNALENNHPLPLVYYYRSFLERGVEPSENARNALARAAELAPFDKSLAVNAALMQAGEGNLNLARIGLIPVASDPHGGALADYARLMLDQMEGVEEGEPWHPAPTAEVLPEGAASAEPAPTESSQSAM